MLYTMVYSQTMSKYLHYMKKCRYSPVNNCDISFVPGIELYGTIRLYLALSCIVQIVCTRH